jgi:proteasome lid subunit RPN8/RPN11
MVIIPRDELDKVQQHGAERYPNECCGVLTGRVWNARNVVELVVQCANARDSRTRYEIDARELVRVQREARELGREIVGFYHSHPDHEAMWSETDFAEAHWIGSSYVIVSVRKGKAAEVKSFRLVGRVEEEKRFEAEEIEVVEVERGST